DTFSAIAPTDISLSSKWLTIINRFSLPISIRKDAAASALAISLDETIINPTLSLLSCAMGANSAETPAINHSRHRTGTEKMPANSRAKTSVQPPRYGIHLHRKPDDANGT